jgi:hypothetical protein
MLLFVQEKQFKAIAAFVADELGITVATANARLDALVTAAATSTTGDGEDLSRLSAENSVLDFGRHAIVTAVAVSPSEQATALRKHFGARAAPSAEAPGVSDQEPQAPAEPASSAPAVTASAASSPAVEAPPPAAAVSQPAVGTTPAGPAAAPVVEPPKS